ncbi:hypothetical protein FOA52_000632 [Chlamydomonas sp. UWO 241]|nr:hypothetical protein FOA52_000632 [Chlamydomonas sp. UWO 241]
MSATCVPLYDSLGENAIEYIISHAETMIAFVQTEKLPQLLKGVKKTQGVLKSIVFWGAGNDEAVAEIKALGYKVLSFADLLEMGAASPRDPIPPKPTDLATIMYTSGTTGDPKGVMLTHTAVITAVTNCAELIRYHAISLGQSDALLSFLPLAHIFDRIFEEYFLYIGGSIGYWQGDVTKLLDDIAALRPAIFIGVPRVFDRIYSRIMGQVNSSSIVKKSLFNLALWTKLYFMRTMGWKQNQASPLFDALVFSKVAARLGGRVKAVISGGAPLSAHVEDFLRCAMCCPVVQGYGLTETGAASFIAAFDVMGHASTVGPPCPCNEFRLESVPEMNYNALDPDEPKGEVLIRGPGTFTGYFKDAKQTVEVLESDGWFHTGDIAVLTPEGAIRIFDRKKNIFKLSQGEYVAVEKVEGVYKKNLLVEQVWVYGSSFKSCLIAVVVPSEAGLMAWASANGVGGTFSEVVATKEARAHVLAELIATGRAEKLKGFEIVRAVKLESSQFTVEDDLLTPTFKLKRPQLQRKFQAAIDEMYKELQE